MRIATVNIVFDNGIEKTVYIEVLEPELTTEHLKHLFYDYVYFTLNNYEDRLNPKPFLVRDTSKVLFAEIVEVNEYDDQTN